MCRCRLQNLERGRARRAAQEPLWIAENGRRLRAREMGDSHLERAIAKIERNLGWRDEWLPRLKAELEMRQRESAI